MKKIKVHSLPLKEVISELALAFNTEFEQDCDLYQFRVPASYGSGVIKGMDFTDGIGFIIYDCLFNEDIELHFTFGKIHPAKFIYILDGELEHQFANETKVHQLHQHQSAIVASSVHHGHVLYFKKNSGVKIYSVETDREEFLKKMECEIDGIDNPLKELFMDTKATHAFYYEGSYNLKLFDRLREIDKSQETGFTRKIFWFATALGILSEQLVNYKNELEQGKGGAKLMETDVEMVKKAIDLINENLGSPVNINVLAQKVNTYPPKLQEAFRFVYGATINKHISKLRIKRAAELLINSSQTITEIVGEVGLVNRGYFAKIFREHYGCTPQEYRQNYKQLVRDREESSAGSNSKKESGI